MRLSSSSEEIATASASRSVRSAKFFTASPNQFRTILNRYKELPTWGQLLARDKIRLVPYFAWGCFRDFLSRPCRAPPKGRYAGSGTRDRQCLALTGPIDPVPTHHALEPAARVM